jgi:plasminogen activator inhibitor 1 RNA-binding protein
MTATGSGRATGGNKSKPTKASREFEGEVVGTEGGKAFHARGGRGDHKGHSRSARRGGRGDGEGRQRSRREFDRRDASGRGHDGHRGGAGKGNWGKAGDELAEEGSAFVEESETEPEVVDNSSEITFEQAEALKAEKKKALAAQWKAPEAKVIDTSAFEGLSLASRGNDDEVDVGNPTGPKAKRERTKNAGAKQTLVAAFRVAPTQPADDRDERPRGRDSGRGGRGGRGGRDSGRSGRDNRGGNRGGRGAKINVEDTSAFPTLGGK